jgi:hypothetical protein
MRATSPRFARSAPAKASVRDKRYVMPCLLVDLLSGIYETRHWSGSQMILRDFTGDLALGEEFTGTFTFDDDPACGLFQAHAVRLDPARRLLGAEFRWLSPPARDLIADALAARQPDAPDQGPVMKLSITQPTINWSLTGMLLGRYHGAVATGSPVYGMIRLEKAQEPGRFAASVIRVNPERHSLALKFQDLPAGTFALLEAAIKKSAAN